MTPTLVQLMAKIQALPPGTVVTAHALSDCPAERPGWSRRLQSLAAAGRLMRIARGWYVCLYDSRFGRYPSPVEAIVRSVADLTNQVVASSPAVTANLLHLTTQVPVTPVFWVSGRSRTLRLKRLKVVLRHAPSWQLTDPTGPLGQAVRLLVWLGRNPSPAALRAVALTASQKVWSAIAERSEVFPRWVLALSSRLALEPPAHRKAAER